MKRFISIIVLAICCSVLVACKDSDHTGKVKIPISSSEVKAQDYKVLLGKFKDNGFTNIKIEKIEDLVTGWLKKDGETENISVGGDFEYSSDEWVDVNTEIIIKYHTFKESETEGDKKSEGNTKEYSDISKEEEGSKEVLDIRNCKELSKILTVNASYEEFLRFSNKFKGRTIKFDGRIDYLENFKDYKTRYDVLLSAGDYNPDHQVGPTFKFQNTSAHDLGFDTLYLDSEIKVGDNIRIIAEISEFNSDTGIFLLKPISIVKR